MTSSSSSSDESLATNLKSILGGDCVIDNLEERRFYSSDVYARGVDAALVIRPADRETLTEAVKAIANDGYAMTVRGGGMSYTAGYTPSRDQTVIIDLSDLNRIIEISEEDMIITVEAGVTWKQIYDALRPRGLRLPFFGTFSGIKATVGGGMSNGALFMATARHGTAAEIVVGMELLDGLGRTIKTGQGAFRNGRPFYRTYGPDLTGLFTHDAGVLGIKTQVSMRMIKDPPHAEFGSFAFKLASQSMLALSEIARSGAVEEAYIFDPETTRRSLAGSSLKQDLGKLMGVMKAEPSLAGGLKTGVGMAVAGRRFGADDVYSLHLVCAGRSEAAVKADLAQCIEIAERFDGKKIKDTIPRATRSNPFDPLNGILGANGERWAALNAKVRHSEAQNINDAMDSLMAEYQDRMDAAGVTSSRLFIAIANHAFSIEPVLQWRDEWLPIHRRTPEPDHLAKFTESAADPLARALVHEIRQRIIDLFAEFGAASNQIGKTYPYLQMLDQETRRVLASLKAELDPKSLLNPGALGQF